MPPELLAAAVERAAKLKVANFSAYIRKLIEQDLITRGALLYEEDAPPPMPPAKPVRYTKPRRP